MTMTPMHSAARAATLVAAVLTAPAAVAPAALAAEASARAALQALPGVGAPFKAIGHEPAWQAWRQALGGERMHHAWILSGRRGVGKSAFALAAARELVAENGVPQPADHPDILYLSHPPKNDAEAYRDCQYQTHSYFRSLRFHPFYFNLDSARSGDGGGYFPYLVWNGDVLRHFQETSGLGD